MNSNFKKEPDLKVKSEDFYTKLEELEKEYPEKEMVFLEFGIIAPDFNVYILDDRVVFDECV